MPGNRGNGVSDRRRRGVRARPEAEGSEGRRVSSKHRKAAKGILRHLLPQENGNLLATEEASEPHAGVSGMVTRVKHVLIGRPLTTSQQAHERVSKTKGLAIFASDALSSTAYATEEILLILVLAGTAATSVSMPIALAIALLLAIVALSYRQTIYKYPHGGGTYIVTQDNFGTTPALIAGSALMIDYVLTVAVSISAGISAIVSALPWLGHLRVELALSAVVLLTLVNLRGVRESATIFTLPTYLFVFSLGAMILLGLYRIASGHPPVETVAGTAGAITEPLSVFLILRAFASGCSALTGTEAISDGVPAFQDPQPRNAAITLAWMATILGVLFLGITFLSHHYGVLPRSDETVLSQVARAVLGHGPWYYAIQAFTMAILILAANTSFADFPRLAYFMARDRFLPKQFVFRGDRLAFSTGIISLGFLAGLLVLLFQANPHHLIPLYAVGVFMAFTFSQSSMVKRWWTRREAGWHFGILINGLGAVTTAVVTVVITVTKFAHGAWMILVFLPVLVSMLLGIRRHYQRVAEQLAFQRGEAQPYALPPPKVVVPIANLNKASLRTLRYSLGLSDQVTAVHVTDDIENAAQLRKDWETYLLDTEIRLVIIESPYRALVSPILAYIETLRPEARTTPITVALSEFVPRHGWEFLLHNQDAFRLKVALFFVPNVVVIDVPYHLED